MFLILSVCICVYLRFHVLLAKRLRTLLEQRRRQCGIKMIKHLICGWGRRIEIGLRGGLHLLVAFLEQRVLLRLVPYAGSVA